MMSWGALPLPPLLLAGACAGGWLVARFWARRPGRAGAAGLMLDACLVGLLAARLGAIALDWRDYAQAPWAMLALGDGRYLWSVGALVALAYAGWRSRQPDRQGMRLPALAGMLVALGLWLLASAWLAAQLRAAPPLPALTLQTVAGAPQALQAYQGRPLVVNLWASWCPPCRREMPAFAEMAASMPDVDVLMINQGESAATVAAFLQAQGLQFEHLLLDPNSQFMAVVGAQGLPTTLLYDAQGRLRQAHMGEMTRAGLRRMIDTAQTATP